MGYLLVYINIYLFILFYVIKVKRISICNCSLVLMGID